MASTIQIRVDDDLKNKSDQLFKDLGTDTTSEEEMLQRLEQSRESSKKGNYRNADDVISDMRGKYGL